MAIVRGIRLLCAKARSPVCPVSRRYMQQDLKRLPKRAVNSWRGKATQHRSAQRCARVAADPAYLFAVAERCRSHAPEDLEFEKEASKVLAFYQKARQFPSAQEDRP